MAKEPKIEKESKATEEKLPLQGLLALLDATQNEYKYLQEARNSLHTRVGILIALLTALVSAAFIKETPGFVDLFKDNIVIAHFRVVCLIALFVSFVVALISYIRVFFTREYYLFPYENFTSGSQDEICKFSDEELTIIFYKEYAKCISHNQNVFNTTITFYKTGNKWLISTIIFAILSIIISLI